VIAVGDALIVVDVQRDVLPAELRSLERQTVYEVSMAPSISSLAEAMGRDAAASD
jgi:nicotinamidase-related amidase